MNLDYLAPKIFETKEDLLSKRGAIIAFVIQEKEGIFRANTFCNFLTCFALINLSCSP
jgi:hypothetical protein